MLHEDRHPADREPAAPEIAKVDLVVTLEVSLYRVFVVSDERGERDQFPGAPMAFWTLSKNSPSSSTSGLVARSRA